MSYASVNIADFKIITAHARSLFLNFEKQSLSDIFNPLKKVRIEDLPKRDKSIWIDIWLGAEYDEFIFETFKKVHETLINVVPETIEVIALDAYNPANQKNSISIIAFG